MSVTSIQATSLTNLVHLPRYAAFLLEHKLHEFTLYELQLSKEHNLPLLKKLAHLPDEKIIAIAKDTASEFLDRLSRNQAREHINHSRERWLANQLPSIDKNAVTAQDISLVVYIRKQSFLHFIPGYCRDAEQIIHLVKEIDLFHMHAEIDATNTYINILKESAAHDGRIIQKVNETIPGAVYVFDIINFQGIYSNDKLSDIIGYSQQELNTKSNVIADLVHEDDHPVIRESLEKLRKAKDKEVISYTYRIRKKTGEYSWLRNYESVFKRDEQGSVIETIGITLDVNKEMETTLALRKTEAIYKQAEELANIGNWNWDIKNNKLEWTDQLYRIYGLEPQSEEMTIERFLSFIDPDDRDMIMQGVQEIQTKDLLDYTFRIITSKGEKKILRSVAHVERNEQGDPVFIVGTERDITEKQTLIDRLKMSEKLFKQAQALTHAGNWSWDIKQNRIEWSDELYRIYGLEPRNENISYEEYIALVHPDDREKVRKLVEVANRYGKPWSFTHRLVRNNGDVRVVFATGEVLRNAEGEPTVMIGTAQDITERQNLIDRLQESEKLFKQAQSLAHLGNWTLDLKTMDFSWSDEMFNIYEVEKDRVFVFQDWVNFIHPEEREEVLNYYQECLREKKLYDKVHRIVLQNGKVKIIHRKGEFVLNENGEAIRMIGTTQDVTKEYKVQQELKENQTFIRKITDATPSVIASYNINTGRYVFISEGLEKLLGYPTSEVMSRGVEFFMEIIHPDDLLPVTEKNAKALQEANADPQKSDIVIEFSCRMKHRNGDYRWFHTYGTIFDRNSAGKVEHVLNITLDITEQVKATEKIKEQEHFIQQIADASPTILYLFDVRTQSVVYINREIFFVLGYSPDEILRYGDSVTTELYHQEDIQLLPSRKESQKTFQQQGSMIQYECRIRSRDGEWKWFLVREIVFKTDEAGQITQILGASLDINRRKEMEKTILQNSMLLEQSNASLEEFAYVASHDLKEPLRKISTFGDRLAASQDDHMSPEGKLYLNKIIDASQRMQTMITDLLSVSMITGNTAFEFYSLQKILEETLQTLEFKLEQLNAKVEADPLPDAYIIPSQFRQLFQNLLSNSLKFVRPDLQPLIRISYSFVPSEKIVHYQLAKVDHYHQLVFTDNGIGFDNEYAGKIFAIFQRLHGRSEYEGSGIGLAICKKIVEHHGGIIYAQGREGEGASFTIILPA